MPEERNRTNSTNRKELPLEDYLNILPQPPEEDTQELKMEKCV